MVGDSLANLLVEKLDQQKRRSFPREDFWFVEELYWCGCWIDVAVCRGAHLHFLEGYYNLAAITSFNYGYLSFDCYPYGSTFWILEYTPQFWQQIIKYPTWDPIVSICESDQIIIGFFNQFLHLHHIFRFMYRLSQLVFILAVSFAYALNTPSSLLSYPEFC